MEADYDEVKFPYKQSNAKEILPLLQQKWGLFWLRNQCSRIIY